MRTSFQPSKSHRHSAISKMQLQFPAFTLLRDRRPHQRGWGRPCGWRPARNTRPQGPRAELGHLPGTRSRTPSRCVAPRAPQRDVESPTCQTRCSLAPGVADRQTLSTMVWEDEVSVLAMTASRMLKGSMVYTTKTTKRKKDTCRQTRRAAGSPMCPAPVPRPGPPLLPAERRASRARPRNNTATERGSVCRGVHEATIKTRLLRWRKNIFLFKIWGFPAVASKSLRTLG